MKKIFRALWAILATTLDALNLFSNDQAITATANSTNIVDQGDGKFDGSNRVVGIFITETFTLLTSLTIALHHDAAEAFSTNGVVFTLPAITLASGGLNAGEYYEIPIPVQALRYLRMTYTVTGTAPDAGQITAGIIHKSGSPTAFRDSNL